MIDFKIQHEGSIVLLQPETDAAREWIDTYIGEENGYQPYYPTIVVEPRYLLDILEGITDDGLECE